MKIYNNGLTRRQVIKTSLIAGAGMMIPWKSARAASLIPGLSDPAAQPKFEEVVPNALDPGFIYDTSNGKIKVGVDQTIQQTGLMGGGEHAGKQVSTTVWGYGYGWFLYLAGPYLRSAERCPAGGRVAKPIGRAAVPDYQPGRAFRRGHQPALGVQPEGVRTVQHCNGNVPIVHTCTVVTAIRFTTATLNTSSAPISTSSVRAGSARNTCIRTTNRPAPSGITIILLASPG